MAQMPFKIVEAHQIPHVNFRPDQTVYVNCASGFPQEVTTKTCVFNFIN